MKKKYAVLQEPALGYDLVKEGVPEVIMLELRSARQTGRKTCLLHGCHARALWWQGEWEAETVQIEGKLEGRVRVWYRYGWRGGRTSRALPY